MRFLRLVRDWDWSGQAMYVDLASDADAAMHEASLAAYFKGVRASKSASGAQGGPAMFVAASYVRLNVAITVCYVMVTSQVACIFRTKMLGRLCGLPSPRTRLLCVG